MPCFESPIHTSFPEISGFVGKRTKDNAIARSKIIHTFGIIGKYRPAARTKTKNGRAVTPRFGCAEQIPANAPDTAAVTCVSPLVHTNPTRH